MFIRFYSLISMFIALLDVYQRTFVICIPTLNGRYTRNIDSYHLTVPFKSLQNGHFRTFKIPHFFGADPAAKPRSKRAADDRDAVHYTIHLDGQKRHAVMWPNYGLVTSTSVSEMHEPLAKVQERKIKRLDNGQMCHYTGRIKGIEGSRVALSTCDGLAGYITVGANRYFIEPVEEHEANAHGQHLHVVYQRSPHEDIASHTAGQCGTTRWEDGWRKRFAEKLANGEDLSKRGTESVHRYLETLVVCDKKFLDYHKNIDVEKYVLTIMNMVADFYHDYSSGNQLDVVVVRIMYLHKEEEEIDLVINPNADDTLASFCKWQTRINPKEISNPNHHDIAVLLTRYDICADNLSKCGLMGLAYVAGACTGKEPCAINEDGGLVLGIVVAHEMGHVMGCAHDTESESSCASQDKDESYFIMAPYVHMYTTRWSTCSRGYITALFENNLGECLNDEPEVTLYRSNQVLPGVVYDADQQCKIEIPGSAKCRFSNGEFCEALLCENKPGSCMSKGEPPADGTKCGENMWCFRKKCVEIGQRPAAINGGWGKWGPFSECSRTCGGGVQIASRECDNPVPENEGRFCLGERKKVKICNLTPCPNGVLSFREKQCQEHNTIPFKNRLMQWRAYFKQDEPCVLYCINSDNTYAKLEPTCKDGTPCKPGSTDMCITGVCKRVGCDGEIDSNAVEDICGICNGDGTQCKVVEETFTEIGRKYHKVAVIPAGSRNLMIEELGPSENTICISDHTGEKFFLNGNYHESSDGVKDFGGVEGIYTHVEPKTESLTIRGPLPEDLVFFVAFYELENVGYRYKYAEPSPEITYTPEYHWEQVDWEDCSVRCGGGFQESKLSCIEEKSGRVSDSFCESAEKLEKTTQTCNEEPCKTKWKVGSWGKCHACKFKSGVRMREVECVKESPHPGTDDILVDDKECQETKPGTRELCNSHAKCKSRRYTDGLPEEMMEQIWMQMHQQQEEFADSKTSGRSVRHTYQKRKVRAKKSHKKRFNKKSCHKGEVEKKHKPKLNVGSIVKDAIPPDEIKVIEVPLKQSHLSLSLSDNAFETMGDKVADSLDTSKAKIATGAAAVKILKEAEREGQKKEMASKGI